MEKLQALGREIRYVEYKLRRQKQEKKKMKNAQKDFTYGTNSQSELNNGGGRTTTAEELNFDDHAGSSNSDRNEKSSEYDKARPSNAEEEKLQLELALAMSRESAPPTQPAAGSLIQSTPVSTQPPATFDPWASSGSKPAIAAPPAQQAAPTISSSCWESFANPPQQQQTAPVSTDPWGAPSAPAQSSSVTPSASWTAFDDSFGAPAPAAIVTPQFSAAPAPKADSFFDLPAADRVPTVTPVTRAAPALTPAAPVMTPMAPKVAQENDLLSGEVYSLTSQTAFAAQKNDKTRKTPTDFLGKGANLVNFDNLVSRPSGAGAINPFMSSGMQKTNPFQAKTPGISINAMASQQNKGGFGALDGTGMAPLQPMNNNSVMQPMQPTSSHAPVFSPSGQNTLFGAKPMSNQHINQTSKSKTNPFNF